MAQVDDLLTIREAAEASGVGYQTLMSALKSGRIPVAKTTKRGKKEVPLLVYRDDVMAYKANKPGRGFVPFADQYKRLMDLLEANLTENQMEKVRSVLTEDQYRRIHYAA